MSMTPTSEVTIRGKTILLDHRCGSDMVMDSLRMGISREARRQQVRSLEDLDNGEYGRLTPKIVSDLRNAAVKAFANPSLHSMFVLFEFAKTKEGLPYLLAPLMPKVPSAEVGVAAREANSEDAKKLVKDLTIRELSDIATNAIAASGLFLVPNSNGRNQTAQDKKQKCDPIGSDSIESSENVDKASTPYTGPE